MRAFHLTSRLSLLLAILLLPAVGRARAQTSSAPADSLTGSLADSLGNALDRAAAAQGSAHYAAAATAYAAATKLSPRLAELWANRGLMEHLSNQPVAAVASFHQALALKPGLFTAILFTGVDEVALGKPEQALPFLRQALAAQPRNPDATLALAKAYAALHQLRPSADAYQAATDVNPGSSVAWYGLAVSSLGLIEQDGGVLALRHPDSVWARMLYADELLAQNRLKEATSLYGETSKLATPAQRAIFLRVFDPVPAVDPAQSPQTVPVETLAALRQALQPASDAIPCSDAPVPSDRGACAFLSGNYARSAGEAAAALAQSPSDLEALFWSVKANERRATLAFTRFATLAPQSPATFDLTGDLYRRRGQPAEARSEYAKALAQDPHDPAALLGTAAAHLSEGHQEQAIAAASAGLADRPEDPRLNLIVAEALVAGHRFADAEPFLQRSLRRDPASDAHVHALLGRVAAEQGETDYAIAEMRLGLSSDRDGSLHFQLYRLLRKSGDLAGAQQAEAGARALQAQRLQHAAVAVEQTEPAQN